MGKKEKDQRLLRRNLLGVCVFLLALPVLWPMGRRGFCHAGDFAGTSIGGGAHRGGRRRHHRRNGNSGGRTRKRNGAFRH